MSKDAVARAKKEQGYRWNNVTHKADRAENALKTYRNGEGGDRHEALQDLLSDLMHLASVKKIDFDDTLRVARDNYEAEVLEAKANTPTPKATAKAPRMG